MSAEPLFSLDAYQQQAVNALGNTIVSAGAGSGKTLVLSLRFLRLVLEQGAGVDQILTLTFTRKAAVEMRERIHRRLMDFRDSAVIARELSRFDQASISTLDSFCAKIARSDSLRYGIPPSFIQDAEACSTLAREAALQYLLASQKSDAVGTLLKYMELEQIISGVLLPSVLDYGSALTGLDPGEVIAAQEGLLRSTLSRHAGELHGLCRYAMESGLPGGAKSTLCAAYSCCESTASVLDDCSCFSPISFPGSNGLEGAMEGLRSSGKMGKPREKHELAQFFREHADRWNDSARTIYLCLSALSTLGEQEKVLTWISEFQQCFGQKRASAELLTFKDTAELALDILKNNLELRRWYKNQYRWIMIDEFQDNNTLQKELLYLLAESDGRESSGVPEIADLHPGKLFFVGDEKQSIYRFRGADVSVFKGLKEEILGNGGESIELGCNYRSTSPLISFFNRVFSSVMGTGTASYEADFSELIPGLGPGIIDPPVTLMYYPYEKDSSAAEDDSLRSVEAEAWYLACRIKEEVEHKRTRILGEDGEPRPMSYDDISMLLRKTSSQLVFEKALRMAGIPYVSDSPRSLFLESPVNDLYLMLRVTAYSEDRLAYAALLRSPFCSLDDRCILELLSWDLPPFVTNAQAETVMEDLQQLERFQAAARLYDHICSLADRTSIRSLVRELWYRGGYRYALLRRREYHPYLEFYDYLQELAGICDRQGDTLALFTDMLKEHLGSNEKLQELNLLRVESGGVRIMTIHKAKGLEFPVVILADAGGLTKGNSAGSFWWSEAYGPMLSSRGTLDDPYGRENILFRLEKDSQEEQEKAELKRMLYVALTRAQQWCIISGAHTAGNRNSDTPLNMLLTALGCPEVNKEKLTRQGIALEIIPPVTEQQMRESASASRYRDVRELAKHAAPEKKRVFQVQPRRFTATGLSQPFLGISEPGYEVTREDRDPLFFGDLTHRIIEHGIKHASLPGSPDEMEGTFSGDLRSSWDEALLLARGFLESPVGMRINECRCAESEVPFVLWGPYGPEGREVYVQGRIDLVLHWEERCEVIDFKTDRIAEPRQHAVQLGIYCDALREITGKPVEGMIYYLRSGEVKTLEFPDSPD